ncbi:MAG: hypothetical protein ACYC8T_18970 [Myxococcaceae bacterium]
MRSLRFFAAFAVLLPALCFAQGELSPPPPPPDSPPPLVSVPDSPGAAPEPGPLQPGLQPPQTGYQYSPAAKPPTEVGLMISEAAFGMLTAAVAGLIPYFTMVQPMLRDPARFGLDATAATLIFALVFTAVPLSVAQTEISIANGSRYYYAESWTASLPGLAAQGAVIGMYFLMGGANSGSTGEMLLLVGSVLFTPLVEMAVLNLAKTPRGQGSGAPPGMVSYTPEGGLSAGLAMPSPIVGTTRLGQTLGMSVPLAGGRF